jgi:hypothetical protein
MLAKHEAFTKTHEQDGATHGGIDSISKKGRGKYLSHGGFGLSNATEGGDSRKLSQKPIPPLANLNGGSARQRWY